VSTTLINGQVTTGGWWGAIDAQTGKILWETADPSGAEDMGAVTVSGGGVVFVESMSDWMYALDARTGKILWSYQAPGSANGGAAIVGNTIYWGDGYDNQFVQGNPSDTFYAFSIGGR
jgi:polyvinyl alcohol dehydrogenase (cytochrome)